MKKKDIKILQEIQDRANAKFGDKLYKIQPKADVMLEVMEKALTTDKDKFSATELEKIQAIKDSHILEGDEKVVDLEVAKKLDDWVGKEVTKAIKEGKLTHPEKDPFIKKIKQNQRKHERRNQKS